MNLHLFYSTIYAHNLKKHIKICPTAKKRKLEEEEPHFLRNVNCGGYGQLLSSMSSVSSSSPSSSSSFEPGSSLWAQRIACRVLRVHQSIFPAGQGRIEKDNKKICGDDDVSAITCQDIHDAIVLKDLSQAEIDAGIIKGFQSHAIKSGGDRHIHQIASLVGHLRQMGLFERRNENENENEKQIISTPAGDANPELATNGCTSCSTGTPSDKSKPLLFLEMGAGRGMLGLAATGLSAACGINTHFCMIDRAGSRSKADTAFRSITENADTSYIKLDEVNWCRLCCDLSHVTLPAVLDDDKYKEAKVVVIAKHLCGAGTDLALKALEPIRHRVHSLLIATCCHGICDYQHYVGRDILRDIMEGKDCDDKDSTIPLFGPSEFDLLRRWCAATVATREAKPRTCVDNTECLEDDDTETEHANVFVENDTTNDNSEKTSVSYVVRELNLSCGIQGLGRACQRLIDYGRSKYIQQQIFQNDTERTIVNLSHYVAADVTPQNAILWAYRKDKPKIESQSKIIEPAFKYRKLNQGT
ncbi:MAG: tRNA:m4X modification enzyme [Bacillariaceae sp.]